MRGPGRAHRWAAEVDPSSVIELLEPEKLGRPERWPALPDVAAGWTLRAILPVLRAQWPS